MTESDKEKFYKLDKKEYIIKKNKGLLKTLKEEKNRRYISLLKEEDLEKLVDKVASWYMVKYADNYLTIDKNGSVCELENNLKADMTIEQLKWRLSVNENIFLNCQNKIVSLNFDDGVDGICLKVILQNKKKPLKIYFENEASLTALKTYCKNDMNIYELKNLLDTIKINESSKNDYTAFKRIVSKYINNLKYRKYIMKLVALNILYSKNTELEKALYRSKKFIEEFNAYYVVDLKTDFLDEIMKIDYSKIEIKEVEEEQPKSKIKLLHHVLVKFK